MAKVVDLVEAVERGFEATITAIGEETTELANALASTNAELAALRDQIANGEVVDPAQIALVADRFTTIEIRVRAISDAIVPPAP